MPRGHRCWVCRKPSAEVLGTVMTTAITPATSSPAALSGRPNGTRSSSPQSGSGARTAGQTDSASPGSVPAPSCQRPHQPPSVCSQPPVCRTPAEGRLERPPPPAWPLEVSSAQYRPVAPSMVLPSCRSPPGVSAQAEGHVCRPPICKVNQQQSCTCAPWTDRHRGHCHGGSDRCHRCHPQTGPTSRPRVGSRVPSSPGAGRGWRT